MTREVDGVAGSSLRQQLEIFGDEGVSLHSLWRAVGRPWPIRYRADSRLRRRLSS